MQGRCTRCASGSRDSKDDKLREAQTAYDELEDDMNDVEGRMQEQTEVVLSLRTKLADATETVHATARLRKQAHDLEIAIIIGIGRGTNRRQRARE